MEQQTCSFLGCTNKISECYIYVPPYDKYELTYCNDHKCSQAMCGNMRNTGTSICQKHTTNSHICNISNCNLQKDFDINYCFGHSCMGDSCALARVGAFYCSVHKCAEKTCERDRIIELGYSFCYGHAEPCNMCPVIGCKNIGFIDQIYCDYHLSDQSIQKFIKTAT